MIILSWRGGGGGGYSCVCGVAVVVVIGKVMKLHCSVLWTVCSMVVLLHACASMKSVLPHHSCWKMHLKSSLAEPGPGGFHIRYFCSDLWRSLSKSEEDEKPTASDR